MTKDLKIEEQRFIVKSNVLIEARYRLSLQESQVILWLLTQIRNDDEDFKRHKLDITEFAKFTDTDTQGKYRELRKITKRLMQRVMEIYDTQTNDFLQVSWLSAAKYEAKQGHVLLEFSPFLKPYLLQLKSQFTKIGIADTLKLKSIYAIRVFELLLQYLSIGHRRMTIDELRAYCGIEKSEYHNYFDLKLKLIEKAKSEISSKTGYQIDYVEVKESRKVVAIEWQIKRKNLEEDKRKDQIKTLESELNYKFALVKDLTEYGYSKSLATKLVKENDEMVIKNALSAVSTQLSKNQVKNPGAMLRTAIREKWHPERYMPHKQNKTITQSTENMVTNSNNHFSIEQSELLSDLSKLLKRF